MSIEHSLFVYGSLMDGFQYHDVLDAAVSLGPAQTRAEWSLLDLGRFPGVVPGRQVVQGELYRVDATLLARLDVLEGCPEFYRREQVVLQGGERALMYVLQPDAVPEGALCIPSASWRRWCARRTE